MLFPVVGRDRRLSWDHRRGGRPHGPVATGSLRAFPGRGAPAESCPAAARLARSCGSPPGIGGKFHDRPCVRRVAFGMIDLRVDGKIDLGQRFEQRFQLARVHGNRYGNQFPFAAAQGRKRGCTCQTLIHPPASSATAPKSKNPGTLANMRPKARVEKL